MEYFSYLPNWKGKLWSKRCLLVLTDLAQNFGLRVTQSIGSSTLGSDSSWELHCTAFIFRRSWSRKQQNWMYTICERKIRYCKYFILSFLYLLLSKNRMKTINIIIEWKWDNYSDYKWKGYSGVGYIGIYRLGSWLGETVSELRKALFNTVKKTCIIISWGIVFNQLVTKHKYSSYCIEEMSFCLLSSFWITS